jgi:anti-sigma factor RsiW
VNCAQIQNLIHAYFDGELDLVRHLEIEHHLQDCAACSHAHESLRVLRSGLQDDSLYHKAPASLKDRLQHMQRRSAKTPAAPRRFSRARLGMATAAAASVVLTIGMGIGWAAARFVFAPEPVGQEVLASHVRSLTMNHVADVESGNQHTVKPWFAGKVSYSLTVKDLADKGYPLYGGRVDYLDDQRVAALVYKHDDHIINLYTWPAEGKADSALQAESRRNFNLVHWVGGEMNYWIISDLNASDLKEFADLVRNP